MAEKIRYAKTLMELLKYPARPESNEPPFETIKEVLEHYKRENNGVISPEMEATLRLGYSDLPEE
jgi:hypothetical protein